MLTDLNLNLGEPDPNQNSEPNQEESFSSPFLAGIPDTDRPVVEKYIKDWDGQVTKKFQSIHDEYKPYKELGVDPDTIKQLVSFVEWIESEPQEVIKFLTESYPDMDTNDTPPVGTTPPDLEFGDLDPKVAEYIKGLQGELGEVKSFINETKSQQEERQQIELLDNTLKEMHTKHGDFDDDYILAQLANGHSPDKAIEKYNELIQKVSSPARKPPPTVLTGGSVPSGQVDLSSLKNRTSRVDLVSKILEAGQA
jgi:vacuolar-type H+-ATPase subunit I/STV1